jgi:hypothetical protein
VNWKLELAKLEFRMRDMETVPELAGIALAEGADTPSLRALSEMDGQDRHEVRERLHKAAGELGLVFPTREDSALELTRFLIEQIISGRIDPHKGLEVIIHRVHADAGAAAKDHHPAGNADGLERLRLLYDKFEHIHKTAAPKDKAQSDNTLFDLKKEMVAAAEEFKAGYLAQKLAARSQSRASSGSQVAVSSSGSPSSLQGQGYSAS